MKMTMILSLLVFCTSVFAKTPLWRKVEDLEKRVTAIEAKVAMAGKGIHRSVSNAQLTSEQQEQFQKFLKSQELLNEIRHEDF